MSQPPPPPYRSKTSIVAVGDPHGGVAVREHGAVAARDPHEGVAVRRHGAAALREPHGRITEPEAAPLMTAAAPQLVEAEAAESSVVYRAVDFEHSVHLDAHGNILAGNGKLDELASLAAYVCRIGSLVGRQLSFGDVTGVETTLASGTFFMHRDANGEIVSIKPRPHLNLIRLRTQLNL